MGMVWRGPFVAGVMLLMLTFSAPLLPGTLAAPGNGSCSASTGLGDLSEARCSLDLGACGSSCVTYRFDITVTADDGLEGSATPYVRGSIAGNQVCAGLESCAGSFTTTQSRFDVALPCEGEGLEDGFVAPPAISSLRITCTRTVV